MIIRFTEGKMPPRNFMLQVAKANPKPGRRWDPYIDTWKRHDLDPDTEASGYPLWRYHYNKHYNPEQAVRYVQRKIETYTDIKKNGFKYTGYIIRAYGSPWNHIDGSLNSIFSRYFSNPDLRSSII